MEWPEPTTDDGVVTPEVDSSATAGFGSFELLSAYMPALQPSTAPVAPAGLDAPPEPPSHYTVAGAFHPERTRQLNTLELGYGLAYRISHCLVGLPHVSVRIASEAVRIVHGAQPVPSDPTAAVAHATIELVMAHHASLVEHGVMGPSTVTHLLHRIRLIRELRRWDPQGRVILALRHLDQRTPGLVARHVGVDEAHVREVTMHWMPSDGRNGSEAMLQGIDAWIGGGLKTPEVREPGPLEILDDPAVVIPPLRSLVDLPGDPLPPPSTSGSDAGAGQGGRLRRRAAR